jgi:hypothetical protein
VSNWTHEKLETLAAGWFEEVRAKDRDEEAADHHGHAVVLMNFTASHEVQWEFIQIAVAKAASESELSAVAAGPFEHLMGSHGEVYINRVEQLANSSQEFRKMVSSSWRHMMSDEVWARVKAIQATAE